MQEGYTVDHEVESGKLITLFSAPDYPQFQVNVISSFFFFPKNYCSLCFMFFNHVRLKENYLWDSLLYILCLHLMRISARMSLHLIADLFWSWLSVSFLTLWESCLDTITYRTGYLIEIIHRILRDCSKLSVSYYP